MYVTHILVGNLSRRLHSLVTSHIARAMTRSTSSMKNGFVA